MKICELCGLENPDEARFCMKCAKDLDGVRNPAIPPEMMESSAFTPAGSLEDAPLAGGSSATKQDKGPMPDFSSYTRSGPSIVENIEDVHPEQDYGEEPPEIQLLDVTSDFAGKQHFCERCGVGNPREQRFCRNCGTPLGTDTAGGRPMPQFGTPGASTPAGPGQPAGSPEMTPGPYAGPPPAQPPMAPMTREEPVETTLLAPMSASMNTYQTGEVAPPRRAQRRGGGGIISRIADWGVGAWLGIIAGTLVIVALIWLFGFGGMNTFSSNVRNMDKAAGTMNKLAGYRYGVSAALEQDTATSGGDGEIKYDSPDKSMTSMNVTTPSGQALTSQHIQIAGQPYINSGSGWQSGSPADNTLDARKLYSGMSNVENLGNEAVGDTTCYHYKYRIPPQTVTGMLGVYDPTGVSDAVMEAWVNTGNFQIVKMTATVFNLPAGQARATVKMTMDLTATGTAFGLSAPK